MNDSPRVDWTWTELTRQLAASGASPEVVEWSKHILDPNTMTLGFARRFAACKRPNLFLHDPERLLRLSLLTNAGRTHLIAAPPCSAHLAC